MFWMLGKNPGQCVMKDGYENMGSILSQAPFSFPFLR